MVTLKILEIGLRLIYEVVFGDENGPRMGFFISFFGVKETKDLIMDKINNVFKFKIFNI